MELEAGRLQRTLQAAFDVPQQRPALRRAAPQPPVPLPRRLPGREGLTDPRCRGGVAAKVFCFLPPSQAEPELEDRRAGAAPLRDDAALVGQRGKFGAAEAERGEFGGGGFGGEFGGLF